MIKISHKKIITLLIILASLGAVSSILLAEKFGLLGRHESGYIHVNHLEDDWEIYLENEAINISRKDPDIKVEPGLRQILVHADNHWPWFKQIRVEKGQVAEIFPFLVEKNPQTEIIDFSDPEYDYLASLSKDRKPAGPESPLKSEDGKTAIWTEDDRVYAEWLEEDLPDYFCQEKCEKVIIPFESTDPIKNIAFWKDRNDVVIISVLKGLYVFEINKNGMQNFVPIYEGIDPSFAKIGNAIYITDENSLIKITVK